jgi:hypothetical protein
MAQRHQPRFSFKSPNYPRLSLLSIAAALNACVGGQIDSAEESGGSGGTAGRGSQGTSQVDTAGGESLPYGGSSSTSQTTITGAGGRVSPQTTIPVSSGSAPLPFGGAPSTIPKEVGGGGAVGGAENLGTGGASSPTTSSEIGGAAGGPSTTTLPELTGTAPLAYQSVTPSFANDPSVVASASTGTTSEPSGTTGPACAPTPSTETTT